jgi:hypothetical protein
MKHTETQNSKLKTQSSKILGKIWVLSFGIWALSFRCLWASGEPDAFALPGVGTRPAGMGGAFVGLSDDIESIYYNPAGLGNLKKSGATAMYQTPSIDTSRSFLGSNVAWDHPQLPGSVGAGWLRMSSTNIEVTNTEEQSLGQQDLSNDLALFGVGVHPFEHWSLGLAMKYYHFGFNGFTEGGYGVDAGAHGIYGPMRFGASFTDIGGTKLTGNSIAGGGSVEDIVPPRLRTGVAAVLPQPFHWPVKISADLDAIVKLQGAQQTRIYSGGEILGFDEHAAFRLGYQQDEGPTFGFGALFGPLRFDYAFLLSQNLKDENRVGMTYRFR